MVWYNWDEEHFEKYRHRKFKIGKYKGKTFEEVRKIDEEYCLDIILELFGPRPEKRHCFICNVYYLDYKHNHDIKTCKVIGGVKCNYCLHRSDTHGEASNHEKDNHKEQRDFWERAFSSGFERG
jgi:hypothetical protein